MAMAMGKSQGQKAQTGIYISRNLLFIYLLIFVYWGLNLEANTVPCEDLSLFLVLTLLDWPRSVDSLASTS